MSELLEDVVTGALPAGTRLPPIDQIAARFACSTTVAREAIRALHERGVVEVIHGDGQRVLAADRWAVLNHEVADAALVRYRDPQLLREATEFLREVGIDIALLAATRVTDGDLRMLEGLLDRMRSADEQGLDFTEAESGFHRTVVVMTDNRYFVRSFENVHAALAAARRRRAPDRDQAVVRLTEGVLAALAARDPQATASAVESYAKKLASWLL